MISRRDFLRRSSLIAAAVVAADQLELLERLSSHRVFTTGGYEPVMTLQSAYGCAPTPEGYITGLFSFSPGTRILGVRNGGAQWTATVTRSDRSGIYVNWDS